MSYAPVWKSYHITWCRLKGLSAEDLLVYQHIAQAGDTGNLICRNLPERQKVWFLHARFSAYKAPVSLQLQFSSLASDAQDRNAVSVQASGQRT